MILIALGAQHLALEVCMPLSGAHSTSDLTCVARALPTPATLQCWTLPSLHAAELHDVLSVDQADEEDAKRKVAKFRDESNKCAFLGFQSPGQCGTCWWCHASTKW